MDADLLDEVADLIFSIFISYVGALEFLYVVRHLYHWSARHNEINGGSESADNLAQLQANLRQQLAVASEREANSGLQAMQDGVLYEQGFRVEPNAQQLAELRQAQQQQAELKEQRRKELEAELLKQKQIEEETRKALAEAEANLAEQQRQREEAEQAENERRMLEAERKREAEQRQLEAAQAEAIENERRMLEAERKREAEQRQQEEAQAEAIANERRMLEAEQQREAEQRLREQQEEEEALEQARRIIAADKLREIAEQQQLEAGEAIATTQQTPSERERKQQLIAENARKFLEAEQEMVELQQRLANEPIVHKVTTQLNQTSKQLYSSTSDLESVSSVEPASSKQTSFSTQPSEEINTTGNEMLLQRQEPDGDEDSITHATPPYNEDYLRSLDGLKSRPLMREDGSGRRRAFKKRRSSGSSNSSHDSRTSREEELKMFTSLEEEEMKSLQQPDTDYTPIKYSSEQTLKVAKGHHRRHKRSPAKDVVKTSEAFNDASLEMLGEENVNPWGEIVPEHYKDTEFWKREKALSIDEEEIELDLSKLERSVQVAAALAATSKQNEEALEALYRQQQETTESEQTEKRDEHSPELQGDENQTNLNVSQMTEENATAMRGSVSPGLRRSPRIEDIDKYADQWTETHSEAAATSVAPAISVQRPVDNGPWRDEHGLLMEGISDFYDFTASINPSRSRSSSRQPSPVPAAKPKNVAYEPSQQLLNKLDIYDDTGEHCNPLTEILGVQQVADIIAAASVELQPLGLQNVADSRDTQSAGTPNSVVPMLYVTEQQTDSPHDNDTEITDLIAAIRDERIRSSLSHSRSPSHSDSRSRSHSPLPTNDNVERSLEARRNKRIKQNNELYEQLTGMRSRANGSPQLSEDSTESARQDMGALVDALRDERIHSHGMSRSCSPLPTAGNIQRSIDARRSKRIQQNDELLERLATAASTEQTVQTPSVEDNTVKDQEKEADDTISTSLLVESLRAERCRSRSRSRSPMPSALRLEQTLENRNEQLLKEKNEKFIEQLTAEQTVAINESESQGAAPSILIECIETQELQSSHTATSEEEEMSTLVATLRLQRAKRSCSKSPMRLPSAQNLESSIEKRRQRLVERNDELQQELEERAKTPEPPRLTVEYVYEIEEEQTDTLQKVEVEERGHSRSRTPSRSTSRSPLRRQSAFSVDVDDCESLEQLNDYLDFHTMLNLEASSNRTLRKSSEERESQLAAKLRQLDLEALDMLKRADEEMELRTTHDELQPETPLTPGYDRTVSEEFRDVQRIKEELLSSGFKRSTYVGESLDLGAEYEPLRREAERFQRSHSPSPSSLLLTGHSNIETAKRYAAEQREVQASILQQLIESSTEIADEDRHGAKPKTDRKSKERIDGQRFKEEQLYSDSRRSTFAGESIDLEYLRREAADFRRSQSKSRSPLLTEEMSDELQAIEAEVQLREYQDKIIDEIGANTKHFKEFSRFLNADFLESERRASDSALIRKSSSELQDDDEDGFLEPEEYHHFRRFSVFQEQQVEEYPDDENDDADLIYSSQMELNKTGDTKWSPQRHFGGNQNDLDEQLAHALDAEEHEQQQQGGNAVDELDYSNGSDDERQTVVEVDDDEIDTDLADYNDRGQTDESHHEISECEEADRMHDRYAGRGAQDWQNMPANESDDYRDMGYVPSDETGAVGGVTSSNYDSDSMTIDQIYNDAIKNRKQSGILRDYDCILQEMSHNFADRENSATLQQLSDSERERYEMWSKARSLQKLQPVELTQNFLEHERAELVECGLRYLGDAEAAARQSTRLRSRYGYAPLLQSNPNMDELEVDLNYKPRREYNWRKNFKLDDDLDGDGVSVGRVEGEGDSADALALDDDAINELALDGVQSNGNNLNDNDEGNERSIDQFSTQFLDTRKYSLGGESITLFSRSPEREQLEQVVEEETASELQLQQERVELNANETSVQESIQTNGKEKPKKKKSKKKTRKEAKANEEHHKPNPDDDDDDYDNLESDRYSENLSIYSRRSSSLQTDAMESPKRISRSRRSSRASNDEALFSPRSSVGLNSETQIYDINEEYAGDHQQQQQSQSTAQQQSKKKTKKRKKQKDETMSSKQQDQLMQDLIATQPIISNDGGFTVSCQIADDPDSGYLLATISPLHSVCVTPLSDEAEHEAMLQQNAERLSAASAEESIADSSSKNSTTTDLNSFDLLKDGNFYPLF